MMNKKGISIGRILLYVLFLSLIALFVWTLFITFKAMKKKKVEDNSVNSSLRMVDNNEVTPIRNFYNKADYPFILVDDRGASSTTRCSTGAFIFLTAGTYTISFDSSFYNNYNFVVNLVSIPGYDYVPNKLYDSGWQSSNFTFDVTTPSYFGLFGRRSNNSTIDIDNFNSFNIMLNTGSIAESYVDFDTAFDNANNYLEHVYFSGFFYNQGGTAPNGNSYDSFMIYDYLPFTTTPASSNRYTYLSNKTYSSLTSYNSNDVYFGYNSNSLFTSMNNTTYTADYYYSGYSSRTINGLSYNNSLRYFTIYFTTSNPIPLSLFNFTLYDSINLPNFAYRLIVKGNDEISISTTIHNGVSFNKDTLIELNPNLKYIYSFSFEFTLQSNFSSYVNSSSIHLLFNNFYGDEQWVLGYQRGFADGVDAADESLRVLNDNLTSEVGSLNSKVSDLNSRIKQQSIIIEQLQSQINNSQNNFKGLFFTFADIPFRTVSNALGFEFWGINLFRFFVGIITALGILWLIKRLYK